MVAVELPEDLDHICISISAAESVASAIEAQDKLLVLFTIVSSR